VQLQDVVEVVLAVLDDRRAAAISALPGLGLQDRGL
jgi:hypothetical protein